MSQYVCGSSNELTHYGVLGMKWGTRRSRGSSGTITIRQASKNAKAAKRTARLESLKQDIERSKSGQKVTMYQAGKNMRKAGEKAAQESLAKDKAHNKRLRTDKNAKKQAAKEKRKQAVKRSINKALTMSVADLVSKATK